MIIEEENITKVVDVEEDAKRIYIDVINSIRCVLIFRISLK